MLTNTARSFLGGIIANAMPPARLMATAAPCRRIAYGSTRCEGTTDGRQTRRAGRRAAAGPLRVAARAGGARRPGLPRVGGPLLLRRRLLRQLPTPDPRGRRLRRVRLLRPLGLPAL